MHAKNPQQIRITSPKNLPYAQIEHDLKDGHHVIVQFFEHTYTDSLLSDINHLCAKYDKNFGVRFFGHYTHFFDCDTLLKIPDVKCLYVDSLQHAVNTHAFSNLNALKKIGIGIYNLEDKEILAFENFKNLEDLILTETKTTSFNLDYLKEYKNLKFLIIGGHTKNIKAIGDLSELQFLSLNSVKKVPVSFVNNLEKLKTFNLFLGSRDNLNEIGETQIEHLNLVRVRGFNDLGKSKDLKNSRRYT
jgi:protein phosphatase 1 regulatory subunit 7